MADRAKKALGGEKKHSEKKKSSTGKKRKVHRMHISRLNSGHFLVEHEHEPEAGMPAEPERHAVEASDLADHVAENMGSEEPQMAQEPAPAPTAAPGAMPDLRPMRRM